MTIYSFDFSCNYYKKVILYNVILVLGSKGEYMNYVKKGKTYLGDNEELVQGLIINMRVTALIVAWVTGLMVAFDRIKDTALRRKIQLRTCVPLYINTDFTLNHICNSKL